MSGIGSTIGGLAGGALGNMILPGVGGAIGTSLGSAIGGSTGLLQNIQAKKLKDQAESYLPAYADPNQTAYLTELQQKRRSIDTGADFAAGMQAIDTTNAGTNEALVRSTGGDVGGTVQALLQSQGVANQGKNQILAQGQQQQMQYNQMYGNLLSRIEDRKLQLQMYRSQQARAEWAKKQQQANQNRMAGLGSLTQQGDNQQGMDWSNPTETTTVPDEYNGNKVYNYEPIMVSGESAPPSVDLSILNQGAL